MVYYVVCEADFSLTRQSTIRSLNGQKTYNYKPLIAFGSSSCVGDPFTQVMKEKRIRQKRSFSSSVRLYLWLFRQFIAQWTLLVMASQMKPFAQYSVRAWARQIKRGRHQMSRFYPTGREAVVGMGWLSSQMKREYSTYGRLFSTTGSPSVPDGFVAVDLPEKDTLKSTGSVEPIIDDWRSIPALNPTINFKSLIIPKGRSLQKIVQDSSIQPLLATRHALLEHVNGRIKVIQDFPADVDAELSQTCKLVLLHPDAPAWDELPNEIRHVLEDCKGDGPVFPISLEYHNFTVSYILNTVLPASVHPPPTAFETIGHVAHLNLRSTHLPYRKVIGQILVETLPNIETVIHKVGEVHGPYRTYDMEVLAGRPETNVKLTESGVSVQFDVRDVYWCSRLSEERQRLLRSEILDGQWIADAFCGVGALILQAAKHKNCRISANDWNPSAVEALRENIIRNCVSERFIDVRCGDAYEFLMDLGTASVDGRLPNHIVMNFPLEAPSFLGALRWWPISRRRKKTETDTATVTPRVHVYTFARADPDTNRTAEEAAVDLIASELLPMGDATHRWEELNKDYDCDLKVHNVRDVAPGKLVLCVTFSATEKLLRYMQGDFE